MKAGKGARWVALVVVLFVTLAVGFSVYTLAAGKKAHLDPGDCCVKPADANCSSCNGVWLCDDPSKPGTCSCTCSPVAANYGCSWNYAECW